MTFLELLDRLVLEMGLRALEKKTGAPREKIVPVVRRRRFRRRAAKKNSRGKSLGDVVPGRVVEVREEILPADAPGSSTASAAKKDEPR